MSTYAHLTVLIVDDYQAMRSVIMALLRKMGFKTILEAQDGLEALDVLRRSTVNLVISDWEMPRMKGLEMLAALRRDPEFTSLPFLLVTAEGLAENVFNAFEAGVSDYIVKPFTPATLQAKIDKILAQCIAEEPAVPGRKVAHGKEKKAGIRSLVLPVIKPRETREPPAASSASIPGEGKLKAFYELLEKLLQKRGVELSNLEDAQIERILDKLIAHALKKAG